VEAIHPVARAFNLKTELIMKHVKKLITAAIAVIALGATTAHAWNGCWFCEYQYRQCVRSGTDIDTCYVQREECYPANSCTPN
jgi:succinate dehydrogenase hydrophobic anchor subunit